MNALRLILGVRKDLLYVPPYVDPRTQRDIDSLLEAEWRARVRRNTERKGHVFRFEPNDIPAFLRAQGGEH